MMNSHNGNENLTLTDADLSAHGEPKPCAGGEKIRTFCPVHGGDNQRSLEVDMGTGRFFCHACRCWGYMDWAREDWRRENGRDNDYRPNGTRGAARKAPAPKPPPLIEPVRDDLDSLLVSYQKALPGSWGEKYLSLRGIPLEVAQAHGVGYAAPKAWVGRKWKGGRLVLPHTRPDGTLVNMYGRAVARGEVPKQSKHDHLSGNKGWFHARVLAVGEGPLFVCEAGLDALAMIAAGYERTVSIYGTYGWRWDWIPDDVREIVIAADADEGGEKLREMIGSEARLRGIRVAYLDDDNYGGEKDAAAAYAAGVLTVGEFPATPEPTPSESPKSARCEVAGEASHDAPSVPADAPDGDTLAAEPEAVWEPEATVSAIPDTLPHADVIAEHSELPDDDDRVEIRCAKDLVRFMVVRCAEDWSGYFASLCQRAESLRIAGGREFWKQSRKMGWDWGREEIEDALFSVAGAMYPDTPAGQPHAYYDELHSATTRYLDEHGIREALTAEEEAEHIDRAVQAMLSGDRSGYRWALREWIEAARDASCSSSPPAA